MLSYSLTERKFLYAYSTLWEPNLKYQLPSLFKLPVEDEEKLRGIFKTYSRDRHSDNEEIPELRRSNCNQCDKSFPSTARLCHHNKQIHSIMKFKCDQCDKEFSVKNYLRLHMGNHVSVKFK